MIKTFPAFAERNFRLYFWGQLVSFAGTWLQNLAQGWLIFELTHSATWTGAVTSAITIPGAIFSVFGGVIIDRLGARRVMFATNALSIIPSTTLGVLTLMQRITPIEVLILAFLGGLVNAFDSPARQVLIHETVRTEEQLISAISINTAMVQSSQFIGPGIAGVLIVSAGMGWTFIINAASFIAVLISLAMMRIKEHAKQSEKGMFAMATDGIRYSFLHDGISVLIVLFAFVGTFGYSFRAILPVIAGDVFHGGADVLSYLAAAVGVGAVSGTLAVTFLRGFSSRVFIIFGTLCIGIPLSLFPFVEKLVPGLIALFFAGAGFTMVTTVIRSTAQIIVASHMKGRMMGILIMSFFGGIAIGSFLTGIAAKHIGSVNAMQANGIILLLFGITLLIRRRKIPLGIQEPVAA